MTAAGDGSWYMSGLLRDPAGHPILAGLRLRAARRRRTRRAKHGRAGYRRTGLVDDDRDALRAREAVEQQGADLRPGQSAEAASERRDGDRADGMAAKDAGEVVEAGGDVLDAAAIAPVALGREVDDETGRPGAGVEDETAPGPDRAARAGLPVGREIGREAALELERQPLAHHADAVDGIDERLAAGGEEVALGEVDHDAAPGGGRSGKSRRRAAHGRPGPGARVRKVAERRVTASSAVSARSMPCMNAERAAPARTSTERRGSRTTSSPGRPSRA